MRGTGALRTSVAPGGALAGPWVRNELWRRARAVPSLDIRFAECKSLVDATTGANLVTFTRASSGTYVDSQGVIRTATTNLLLRSEEFDSASWSKANTTVTADQAISPAGTTTADRVQGSSGGTGTTYFQQTYATTAGANASYTFSIYLRSNTGVSQTLRLKNTHGGVIDNFSSNITVTTSWQRFSFTVTNGASAGTSQICGLVCDTSNNAFDVLAWGAQLEQSSTVGEYIPTTSTINSAPRFDHNPTTGESLGLLVEEQRTNSIRNNTMVGAVAGTPGTMPTNWGTDTPGLTREIVGIGIQNGINYIDIRISGTSSAAYGNIFFDGSTGIAATNNQAWAHSLWASVAAGSTTNISAIRQAFDLYGSGGAYLATVTSNLTGIASTLSRFSAALTTNNASTAYVRPSLSLLWSNGAAIDITLRIGLPQLEQGAFATSVIPTSTAAATRSADVASISGSNFSSWYRQDEGVLYAEAQSGQPTNVPASVTNGIAAINDNSASNRVDLRIQSGGLGFVSFISSGGVAQATLINSGTYAPSTFYKSAVGYAIDNFARVNNGGALATDTSGSVPSGSNRLWVGVIDAGSNPLNGTIRRLVYWGQRLPNNVLQSITQ